MHNKCKNCTLHYKVKFLKVALCQPVWIHSDRASGIPDFAKERLVKYQTKREEDETLQEHGDEHPAQNIHAEGVLVGVHSESAQDLHLHVNPCQLHQPITKAELRED